MHNDEMKQLTVLCSRWRQQPLQSIDGDISFLAFLTARRLFPTDIAVFCGKTYRDFCCLFLGVKAAAAVPDA
jgi:hypothetical protein